MQAVILAAGKSTRTYPLTLASPKPLLKVAGKAILERNLDALIGSGIHLSEIILVVGYKKEMIEKYFGSEYKKIKIKYVEQKEQLGTGNALLAASGHIKGRFILMMGDNIYSKEDIAACLKWRNSILVSKVKDPENYGVVKEKRGFLDEIIEKPKSFISDTVNAALYVLDGGIFWHIEKLNLSQRNELEVTDGLSAYAENKNVKVVHSSFWIPVGGPKQLLNADKLLRNNENIIGKKSKIEGSIINSNIGGGCIIKGSVKNCIIMDNTVVSKNSMVSDSILGGNVKFSGKADGCFIGDSVIAEDVSIAKGVRVWPNKNIKGRINKDISDGS